MLKAIEDLLPGDDPVFAQSLTNAQGLFAGPSPAVLISLWLYVASFLAIASISYLLYGASRGPRGLRGFLGYVFPRDVYLHRSTWVDLKLLLASRLVTPVVFLLAGAAIAILASKISHALSAVFGHDPRFEASAGNVAFFTLCLVAISDFGTFLSHALHHRVPWLWEFHKVHHSAEVLTPLTVFRKHPVYDIVSKVIEVALLGPFQGLVFFLFAGPVSAYTVFGTNVVIASFHLLGGTLRHSHMWLPFGPVLSRIFVSPAQHQIHHSAAPQHFNKNFGEVFALWDWIFGTLYVPREKEELRFGTGEPQAHPTLRAAWIAPFRSAAARLRGRIAAS